MADRLLAVVRFGVGYDMVDVEACTRAGVALCITRGAVNHSVAEAILTWMLALSHRLVEKDRLVRGGGWAERAGMVQVKMLHDYTTEEWDFLMRVNVTSSFWSLKYAFPLLQKNQRSYIVLNGSISSFVGQAMTPAYTTSKGAMLQLCKSIALDYAAWGVRCNIVCPGITDTPMLREHIDKTPEPEETLRQRLRRVCLGVPLSPMDVAKSFLYFSCEDSVGITGTSLIVNAGYLAAAEWDTETFRKMAEV